MEAKQYFIYLFRIKKTCEVIYVGSTRAIGSRLNEHRRGMREQKHELPIHRYMKEQGLKLFDDVEICIVEYLQDTTREEALKKEAEYFYRYEDTVKNKRPAEIRDGKFHPRIKPVKCLNDCKIYISIREAAKAYNITRYTLSNHLNKGSMLKSGLVFEYVDPNDRTARQLYKIMCVEDETYFSSIKECAKVYGMTSNQIYNRLRNSNEFIFCGKHFVRCNDYRK